MSNPCVTLSEEFYYLIQDWNSSFRFECIPLNISGFTNIKDKINTNKIIEDIIAKSEVCPILMVNLCKENIRLTSCGHAFSKDIERWISEKRTCPLCRSPQNLSELSKYN
jgi:hypothetical protein